MVIVPWAMVCPRRWMRNWTAREVFRTVAVPGANSSAHRRRACAVARQMIVPAGPAGPGAPRGPFGPAGPGSPVRPFGPAGPCGPVSPCGPVRAWGSAPPVAERFTVAGLLGSLLAICSVAWLAPWVWGLNLTVSWQLAPGAIVARHLSELR